MIKAIFAFFGNALGLELLFLFSVAVLMLLCSFLSLLYYTMHQKHKVV